MNLILDAFERVFYSNNSTNNTTKRRASSSGLVTGPVSSSISSSSRRTTSTTMTTTTTATSPNKTTTFLTTESRQQPIYYNLDSSQQKQRRQSIGFGTFNDGFQNEFVSLTIDEPSDYNKSPCLSSTKIKRQQSINSTSRSRSSNTGGSKRQRKKSFTTNGNDKSHSMVSLLFSALSSPSSISGTDNINKMRRKKFNNCNRMSGRRRHLPPRQWSVPERDGGNIEQVKDKEDNKIIAEPFRLIQKAYSLTCEDSSIPLPSSSHSSLIGSPHSPLSISSHNCFNSGGKIILLGFINQSSSINSSFNECLKQLENKRMFDLELYFLKCIDSQQKLPFIYFATIPPFSSDNEHYLNNLSETIDSNIGDIQLGSYEELYTLERASEKPNSSQNNNSTSNHGFILIFFRLLGETEINSSIDLENRWLTWTGAGQIYRYSPRCWELQKVCFLKNIQYSSSQIILNKQNSTNFAYILLCEFNEILNPLNAIAALDFCERLRTRNCGLVTLYKVCQKRNGSSSSSSQKYLQQQKLSFDYHKETNLSPNWPLLSSQQQQKYNKKYQLGRMGRSHDERISIEAKKELLLQQQQKGHSPPSPRPSCSSNERGYSQQSLNDKGGGGSDKLRRLIWSREQQHSLGWDNQQQPQQWFGQTNNGTLL